MCFPLSLPLCSAAGAEGAEAAARPRIVVPGASVDGQGAVQRRRGCAARAAGAPAVRAAAAPAPPFHRRDAAAAQRDGRRARERAARDDADRRSAWTVHLSGAADSASPVMVPLPLPHCGAVLLVCCGCSPLLSSPLLCSALLSSALLRSPLLSSLPLSSALLRSPLLSSAWSNVGALRCRVADA
jgi:hypothetical protein